jgi:hypothetical protein
MSSDAAPISRTRFAAALKDLTISSLHSKVLEIRNQIAHLDYSNEQLREFANDEDCVEAIKENEVVIARMEERVGLLRKEVEERGVSWTEFKSEEEIKTNGHVDEQPDEQQAQSNPWTDGTFQTGRISGGEVIMDERNGQNGHGQNGQQGGRLSDEELRRQLEQRLDDVDGEDGMHL